MPVGTKNPTSGDLSVMMNAITAAHHSHEIIYRGWDVETTGHPITHAILRDYINKHGEAVPNYHYEDLSLLCELYNKSGLAPPHVSLIQITQIQAKSISNSRESPKKFFIQCVTMKI